MVKNEIGIFCKFMVLYSMSTRCWSKMGNQVFIESIIIKHYQHKKMKKSIKFYIENYECF